MTNEEQDWRNAMATIMTAAYVLQFVDLERLIDKGNRALAVGPIFNPTLWMEKRKALEEDLDLMRAALPLYRLGKQMQERAGAV